MNKIIIDQSYVPAGLYDTFDPRVSLSVIQNILRIAKEKGMKNPKKLNVLDVGAGDGNFAFVIEKYVNKVVAIEPDDLQYRSALRKKKKNKSKVAMYKMLIEDFSTNERFDLVLCLTVLEHMPNARASFNHIFKLMKRGAMIYLTVPNRLWPYEYHYRLFFLSWLPLPLANLYVRLFKRGQSFTNSSYSPTYYGIKNFFNRFNCTYEFIPPDPLAPYLGWGLPTPEWYSIMQNVGIKLLNKYPFFWFFSKTFMMVIVKK